ncbi:hypothetical protein CB0940_07717 [Cercospora beticola]|uniref:Uncharacterized protein n=1 Tax=Cercospora beticola TaxID=122368 RepID=A0A2G5H8C3_CERBT|nr:hypothetical protein CB0940_07717 [Cercospora beticola]PIA88777.1 hypothetical protein CB0940_07717 [Cercospora beticola]WPB03685.1 hypothetical protein RHO25_008329 [Cercospora beticola]
MEEENDEGYVTFVEGEDDEADDDQEYEEYSNYSREDTVEAFRDYYNFLTTMYMDQARIIEPPEDGWPEITPATITTNLGKTEEVCALLRELPYIEMDHYDEIDSTPACVFADWNWIASRMNDGYKASSVKSMTEDNPDEVPPHVISLVHNTPDDPTIYLDTAEGYIYWLFCPDTIWNDPNLLHERAVVDERDYPENEREWRGASFAWWIPHFFEVLKDQFLRLKWFPCDDKRLWDSTIPGSEDLHVRLRRVFYEHGWPDLERYRKKECLEAVEREIAAWYERKRQLKESASTEQQTESVTTV